MELGTWNLELGTPTPRKAGGLRRAGFLFGQKFADVKLRSRGEIIEGAPQPVTTLPDRIREGGDAFLLPLYGDRELNFEQGAHDGTVLGLQVNPRRGDVDAVPLEHAVVFPQDNGNLQRGAGNLADFQGDEPPYHIQKFIFLQGFAAEIIAPGRAGALLDALQGGADDDGNVLGLRVALQDARGFEPVPGG